MIRYLTKLCFLLIPLFLTWSYADAQTKKHVITPLNKHFFHANPRDSSNHIYNQIFSPATTSTKIYTKSNILVKSIEDDINPEGGFNQRTIKRYDSRGKLTSKTIKNLDDHNLITYYIDSDTIRGEVVSIGNTQITITRANRPNPYQVFWNDFEPRPKISKEEWYNFLTANLNYPSQPNRPKETGTVYIALLVDKEGQILEKELANPENVSDILAREALHVINLYQGGFFSALNTETSHVTQWAYIPIRFSLGGETTLSGNAEFDR